MNDRLKMCDPTIFEVTHSATSSPESASGATHYEVPDGMTPAVFGQVLARANLSARQATEKGLLMSGTFGPPSSSSLRSAALQSCLESRLQARTQTLGSTLYKLTWKQWVTPSGQCRFRLRASAHRTSETDCTGWVTPSARDWKDTPGMAVTAKDGRIRLDQLPRQAALMVSGPEPNGVTARTEKGVRLNPELPRWLMGLPPMWDACAPTATPSTRKPRKNS